MNLEELKSRLEEGFHADEKELYADIFNPSLVSKLLELFECAQHQVKHYPMHTNIGLIDAVRDLEQS